MISVVKDLEEGSDRVGKIILQPLFKDWFRQRSMHTKPGGHFNENQVIDWLESNVKG